MTPITYTVTDFRQGMSPNIYKEGVARIEHFDTITSQLRPYRTQTASNVATINTLSKFALVNSELYCLAKDGGSPAGTYGIGDWDRTTFDWSLDASFGATGTPANVLASFNGKLYGLWKGTHLWEMTTTGTFNGTYKTATYLSATADPIVHSKDGLLYVAYDNKLASLSTGGTWTDPCLTLPANFLIASIAEQEEYINIVGVDTQTGIGTSYVWDRDSAATTLTTKYDLGYDVPRHNFAPGGVPIIVCKRGDSSNTPFDDEPVLVVKTPRGDRMEPLHEFKVDSIDIGGKWVDVNKLYFAARVQFPGESAARNVIMSVDYLGRVIVEQNLGVHTGTQIMTGILRDGDGFWVAAGAGGQWHSATTYATTSSFETSVIRSQDFSQNLKFVGAAVTCESLPASSSIVLKARFDATDTWTTLETFSTESAVKFTTSLMVCMNSLPGIDRAKQIQFRLESTGGAVITGFQATFEPVSDEKYG